MCQRELVPIEEPAGSATGGSDTQLGINHLMKATSPSGVRHVALSTTALSSTAARLRQKALITKVRKDSQPNAIDDEILIKDRSDNGEEQEEASKISHEVNSSQRREI